jgi:hypothetical protein
MQPQGPKDGGRTAPINFLAWIIKPACPIAPHLFATHMVE